MPHIYLAPWEWNTAESPPDTIGVPFWDAPLAQSCLQRIDLRPVSVQAEPGGVPQGFGLFVYNRQVSVPGAVYFGSDLKRALTRQDRDSWKGLLSISEPLEGVTLEEVLWNTLTIHADATGRGRVKPLLPRANGEMSLRLPSFGLVRRKKIGPSDAEWSAVVGVLQGDYRRLRQEFLDSYPAGDSRRESYKKVLGTWRLKYGVSDHRVFIPPDLPDEGYLRPDTTIGDTFVEASDTNLESHTPTGPNAGTGWALVQGSSGDLLVRGATDDVSRTVSSGRVSARMTDALSGDDHYAQASCTNTVNGDGSARHTSVAGRMSSTMATYYMGSVHRASDTADPYTIVKIVSGTYTELGSASGTGDSASNNILKLEVNGSDLDLYGNDGTELKVSVTDTSITGNLHAGISGSHTGSNRNQWNNFEAADLSPGGRSARSSVVIVG
jgi:hypothetical protein